MAVGGGLLDEIRPTSSLDATIAPNPEDNRADRQGRRSGKKLADEVAEQHRRNLQARRYRDLTSEKYMMHIDGEGDAMYADILFGSRVEIPRQLSPYREQENLLRLVADNAVAYHTTMPFRFIAEGGYDRQSRSQSRVDAAFANHIARSQRLNSVFGQAFYMAIPCGFCPVHAYWRDDLNSDPYEPLYLQQDEQKALLDQYGMQGLRRGIIDSFVGNPFDHTFNSGAKRDSIQAQWYGRVLPAESVRNAFSAQLDQQGVKLEGSEHLPSASVFQRIARKWYFSGVAAHGTAALLGAQERDEELIALVCREVAKGVDPEWPDGRLTIIALQGETSTRPEGRRSQAAGEAILLADQPLPGGRFSSEIVYSHHRFDDVHGKPWIADADDANVILNLLLSKEREYIERSINAPTIVGGPLVEDSVEFDGYSILEMELGATMPPRTMELPQSPARMLKDKINDMREYIFRVGGYQAASRGEGMAGDSAAKVVALARADDTIHGPINTVFRDTVQRYMGLCHDLFRQYGDVPWIINATGEDYVHLADGYVDRTKVSDKTPEFKLVSGYGATPETQGQQLLGLVTARGADGKPLLPTDEFRRRYPDQTLYIEESNPRIFQKRRAKQVAEAIRDGARDYRERTGFDQAGMGNPWVRRAGWDLFQQVDQNFIRMRDDDPDLHIAALSEITQDETEDPIARHAAIFRQGVYYQWKSQMMMNAQQAQMGPPGGQQKQPGPGGGGKAPRPPTGGAPDVTSPANRPNASSAQAANPQAMNRAVTNLTREARSGAV